MKGAFAFLQKIGKALMLPVSVLPVAGILLGVGAAKFGPADSRQPTDGGGWRRDFWYHAADFRDWCRPGLTKNDGAAALASVIGYAVLLGTLGVLATAFGIETKKIMGVDTLDTGVFGGIASGGLAAFCFNRFFKVKLPPYLGFFSGKRLVPIMTAFGSILLGGVFSIVWPPVGRVIASFSDWAAEGTRGVFAVRAIERSLIPFGLHHIGTPRSFSRLGVTPTGPGS